MTATLETLLATPAPLRAWLEAQPAGSCVGVAGLENRCPVYSFLAASGVPLVAVNAGCVELKSGKLRRCPDWLSLYIQRLDFAAARARILDDDGCCDVSREQALRILGGAAVWRLA